MKKTGDFFEQLDSATVTALDREQLLESYRHQDLRTLAALPEASMVAGYQERLAASDKLLLEARKEIIDLNGKLTEAKVRTKKLTEILLSGEMKEKTEVLVQVTPYPVSRVFISNSTSGYRFTSLRRSRTS